MVKVEKLHQFIERVAEDACVPYWIVKMELAEEAKVGSVYELTEEEIDKMLALEEKYYGSMEE